ncbi:HlyD family secretion protein [Chitinimonas taiwanensis]|uniref:HlyD family secretion protein n=1 Tax=Chitinimonas taiwanensis TaxID=240412 RepID=UPI0035B17F99
MSKQENTESLFRPEALAHKAVHAPGQVVLNQPRAFAIGATLVSLLVLTILTLLFTQSYTRRVPASGTLQPDKGQARLYPMQAGQVLQKWVVEGQRVADGQALFSISAERQTRHGALGAAAANSLAERRASLQRELANLTLLASQQKQAIQQRITDLAMQVTQLSEEIASQYRRTVLAQTTLERYQELAKSNFVPALQVQQRNEELLEQQGRLAAMQRNKRELQSQLNNQRAELAAQPLRESSQRAQLERSLAILVQEDSENEARRELIIKAPSAGTITNISAEPGQMVASDSPLATVIPAGSNLLAHFYLPSSAIGFVQPGQTVQLRYAAFPYQKFGQQTGHVVEVARSAVRPNDGTEPQYRITVRPNAQTIIAYGRAESLQPDMRVEADIAVDRRRIIEWIFEPLLSIKGSSL